MNAIKCRTELMVGLTYSQAKDVILVTLLKVFDLMNLEEGLHWQINRSDLTITFFNGGRILIRSAEIGNKLRGINASDIFIDEFSYLKDIEVYNVLLGRLRESKDGQIFLTTSPKGHNFAYDVMTSSNTELIRVSTFKNVFLPDQYIRNMIKQYSAQFIQQELYGEFVEMGGTILNSEWIKKDLSSIESKEYSNAKRIRFWDLAFSENGDYSAGVLLAKVGEKYVIEDIVRVKQKYTDLRRTIIDTAIKDGRDVMIGIEQAGQQKAVIQDINSISELALYQKRALNVAKYGHKIKRILPLASTAENGFLYIAPTCRNKQEFFNECNTLTMDDSHKNDDMVDSCASAYIMFNTQFNAVKGVMSNIY